VTVALYQVSDEIEFVYRNTSDIFVHKQRVHEGCRLKQDLTKLNAKTVETRIHFLEKTLGVSQWWNKEVPTSPFHATDHTLENAIRFKEMLRSEEEKIWRDTNSASQC